MKQLDEGTLGYLAGIIDADGCISASRYNTTKGYRVAIIVGSTAEGTLRFLKEATGEGYLYKTKKYKLHHKQAWSWTVHGEHANEMLKAILPFLTEKHQQAILAIELRRRINEHGSSGKKLAEKEIEERNALIKQISKLKR